MNKDYTKYDNTYEPSVSSYEHSSAQNVEECNEVIKQNVKQFKNQSYYKDEISHNEAYKEPTQLSDVVGVVGIAAIVVGVIVALAGAVSVGGPIAIMGMLAFWGAMLDSALNL